MPTRRGILGSVVSGASMELRPSVLSHWERHKPVLAAELPSRTGPRRPALASGSRDPPLPRGVKGDERGAQRPTLGILAGESVADEVVHVRLGDGVVVRDVVAVVAARGRVLAHEGGQDDAKRVRVAAGRRRQRTARPPAGCPSRRRGAATSPSCAATAKVCSVTGGAYVSPWPKG